MWIGLSEPSPGSWSCHGRPRHGSDALLCGGCGAVMLPRYPGDWLSGRAPRSHRGGHWFDPSIAHGLATAARRSLIGFAEGRDTFRGPSPRTPRFVVAVRCSASVSEGRGPRTPAIGGTGRRSASRLVQLLAPRTPAIGGAGRLFGFCPGSSNWRLRFGVQLLFSVVTGRFGLLTGNRASPGGRDPRSPPRLVAPVSGSAFLLVLPESASALVSHPVSGALRGKPSATVIWSSLIQTSRRP